jgi:flagellar protein FlbD
MILLHRLAHEPEPFWVNPDLIATVEANPDCHVGLTTGTKLIVVERPEVVVERIRSWRSDVLSEALSSERLTGRPL